MKYTRNQSECPHCGHPYLMRRKRRWWMRLIGVEKHLRCEACRRSTLFRANRGQNSTA